MSESSAMPDPMFPPAPDEAPSMASGYTTSSLRRSNGDHPGDDTPLRLYWTLSEPDSGPGRPLLLVNGLGSPLVAYEAGFVAELMERGFSVLRFDNRDVGRSDRVSPGDTSDESLYTVVELAADAVAVMDAAGWDTAHVFGQSMGGMIVQQMAINHATRLRTMTSLMSNTGERGYGAPSEEAFPALVKPAPRDREGWLDNRVQTEKIWASPGSWDPAKTRAKGEKLFDYGIDTDGTGRQFRAIMASGNRRAGLTELGLPTLVIHGSADTLIDPSGGRRTAEVIPGARYVELEGFGHDLPADFWPVMADTVAGFITDVSPES